MNSIDKAKELKAKLEMIEAEHDEVVGQLNENFTDELNKENVRLVDEMMAIKEEIRVVRAIPEVGKYANKYLYSDVEPYEIVKIVSDTTIEVRAMNTERAFQPEFAIGGFAGHCTNNDNQEWKCTPNEKEEVVRIRKNKRGEWVKGSQRFSISDTPIKKYDYNF